MRKIIVRINSERFTEQGQTGGVTEYNYVSQKRDGSQLQPEIQNGSGALTIIGERRDPEFSGGDFVEVSFRKLKDEEVNALLNPPASAESAQVK